MPKKKALSYQDAISELQHIVDAIESEEVQVDELAASIARANELIQLCKQKLRDTQEQIEQMQPATRQDI